MPIVPIILTSLASSVVSLVVSNITQQPAITINEAAVVDAKTEKELLLWKSGLFLAIGYIAYTVFERRK